MSEVHEADHGTIFVAAGIALGQPTSAERGGDGVVVVVTHGADVSVALQSFGDRLRRVALLDAEHRVTEIVGRIGGNVERRIGKGRRHPERRLQRPVQNDFGEPKTRADARLEVLERQRVVVGIERQLVPLVGELLGERERRRGRGTGRGAFGSPPKWW